MGLDPQLDTPPIVVVVVVVINLFSKFRKKISSKCPIQLDSNRADREKYLWVREDINRNIDVFPKHDEY